MKTAVDIANIGTGDKHHSEISHETAQTKHTKSQFTRNNIELSSLRLETAWSWKHRNSPRICPRTRMCVLPVQLSRRFVDSVVLLLSSIAIVK